MLREIAREVSETVERTMSQVDVDGIASTFGVDPDRAREWAEMAAGIVRSQAERLGDEVAGRAAGPRPAPSDPRQAPGEDPLRQAAPHPLDLPSDEQGLALAALDSGRWTVELSTNRLTSHGEGSGPSDALGLVRELRAHDWLSGEGEVTLAGHYALSRWLDAQAPR
jgi:hypothetical protein